MHRRRAYLLLETVLATGMLILGLAVLGAQFQDGVTAIKRVNLEAEARLLAETQLAEMSLGLIEFDSVDDVQEEEFGSRHPSFGWRLILNETANPDLFHLTLEILHYPRETDEERFDFDEALVVDTFRTMRVVPRKVNLQDAFGIPDDEFEDLTVKMRDLNIPEFDPSDFDFQGLAKVPFEDLITALPLLLEAFNINADQLFSQLPPEYRDIVQGLMEQAEEDPDQLIGGEDGGSGGGGS